MVQKYDKEQLGQGTIKPMTTTSPLPSPTAQRELPGQSQQQRPTTTSTPGPMAPQPTYLRAPEIGVSDNGGDGSRDVGRITPAGPPSEEDYTPTVENTDTGFLSDQEQETSRSQRLQTQMQAQQALIDDPMGAMQDAGVMNQYTEADIYEKNPDGSIKVDFEGNPIVRPEFSANAIEMGAVAAEGAADIEATNATAQTSTASTAQATPAQAAAQAIVSTVDAASAGEASTATAMTIDNVQQAQAVIAELSQGTAMTVEQVQLMERAQDVIVQDYEASIIPLDAIAGTLDSVRNEQPMQAASVATKLNGLLSDLDNGEVPTWARPAVAKVEQALAGRGISASSVGRDSLFNAIINAAMPIASADAQFEQQASASNHQAKMQAILQDSSQEFAARQFNASSENQRNQYITGLRAQVNMQNAARADAMSQFNASSVNRRNEFNVQQQNAMTVSNVQQANAMAQANAANLTNVNLANVSAQNQAEAQNVAAANTMAQFNASQSNALAQVNANLMQQANLSNAAAANSAALQNQQMLTQVSLANADSATRTALANAQMETSINQANADRLTNVDLQNAAMQLEVAKANQTARNVLAQHNSSLEQQREQFNAQQANVIAQANVQWRRQLNEVSTAGINASNAANVANAFNLNAAAHNNLWQQVRDEAHWAEQATENELARNHAAQMMVIQQEFEAALAAGQNEGTTVASALSAVQGTLLDQGASALTDWILGLFD